MPCSGFPPTAGLLLSNPESRLAPQSPAGALRKGEPSARFVLRRSCWRRHSKGFPLCLKMSRTPSAPRSLRSLKTRGPGRRALPAGRASCAVLPMRRSRNIAAERLAHWTISFDRIPHHTAAPPRVRQPARRYPAAGEMQLDPEPAKGRRSYNAHNRQARRGLP